MNSYSRFIGGVWIALALSGCESTASDVGNTESKVVVNDSRCGVHKAKTWKAFIAGTKGGKPIVRASPKYPTAAAKQRLNGYVKMEFDVSDTGKPVDINVVESYPGTIFATEAKKALSKWKYAPNAVKCKAIKLSFNLK